MFEMLLINEAYEERALLSELSARGRRPKLITKHSQAHMTLAMDTLRVARPCNCNRLCDGAAHAHTTSQGFPITLRRTVCKLLWLKLTLAARSIPLFVHRFDFGDRSQRKVSCVNDHSISFSTFR